MAHIALYSHRFAEADAYMDPFSQHSIHKNKKREKQIASLKTPTFVWRTKVGVFWN